MIIRLFCFGMIFAMIATCSLFAQDSKSQIAQDEQSSVNGRFEIVKSQVLRVYAAEYNGARFRAYHVKWNDQDVIVRDMLGTTDFIEGDVISYMVQRIEIPGREKSIMMLQFIIRDKLPFETYKTGSE